jgi:hypothetical protein
MAGRLPVSCAGFLMSARVSECGRVGGRCFAARFIQTFMWCFMLTGVLTFVLILRLIGMRT